mmetsp:Transcript_63182/g.73952  ORF Transcript_63182/g.73952 Transcript_63182/m.73952 type:complete len:1135 (+) Transcript_63182:847-4251(+)
MDTYESTQDNGGFGLDYQVTSINGSPYIFVFTLCYCILCLILIPVLVTCGRQQDRKRMARDWYTDDEEQEEELDEDEDEDEGIQQEQENGDIARPFAFLGRLFTRSRKRSIYYDEFDNIPEEGAEIPMVEEDHVKVRLTRRKDASNMNLANDEEHEMMAIEVTRRTTPHPQNEHPDPRGTTQRGLLSNNEQPHVLVRVDSHMSQSVISQSLPEYHMPSQRSALGGQGGGSQMGDGYYSYTDDFSASHRNELSSHLHDDAQTQESEITPLGGLQELNFEKEAPPPLEWQQSMELKKQQSKSKSSKKKVFGTKNAEGVNEDGSAHTGTHTPTRTTLFRKGSVKSRISVTNKSTKSILTNKTTKSSVSQKISDSFSNLLCTPLCYPDDDPSFAAGANVDDGNVSLINGRNPNLLDVGLCANNSLLGGRRRRTNKTSGREKAMKRERVHQKDLEMQHQQLQERNKLYHQMLQQQQAHRAQQDQPEAAASMERGDESTVSYSTHSKPSNIHAHTASPSSPTRKRPHHVRQDSYTDVSFLTFSTWGGGPHGAPRANSHDEIGPEHAADANIPDKTPSHLAAGMNDYEYHHRMSPQQKTVTVCCGPYALWKPRTFLRGLNHVISLLISIPPHNHELKRLLSLGLPLLTREITERLLNVLTVILIAKYLNTNAVAAYVTSRLFMGMADEFLRGLNDATHTVCLHAASMGYYHLVGQYVQISVILYFLLSIPTLGFWGYNMEQVLLWMGLGEEIASLGQGFARVVIFQYLVEGVADGVFVLLDIMDQEEFKGRLNLAEGLFRLAVTAILLMNWGGTATDVKGGKERVVDLVVLASVWLWISLLFFMFGLVYSLKQGWLRPFLTGMVDSMALKNKIAVKNVVHTALPLALGSFLAYGEWEVLTVFIAHIGPAEVATWGLLGTLWSVFEAGTEGLGEAAAIRVAYHLGKNNPAGAEMAAHKSLLLGCLLGLFFTSLFYILGESICVWMTSDVVLQNLLVDLIPIVGMGNITMTLAMMSWSIVGAQGRYRLVMLVIMMCSWGLTIPVSAIAVYGLNFDLQGVVGSVVIGYGTAGLLLSYILIRSDWTRLSKIVQELNGFDGDDSIGSNEENEDEVMMDNKRARRQEIGESHSISSKSSSTDDNDGN